MKTLKRMVAALGLLAAFGLAHIAHSEPLTSQQVERFIASMPELTALGEKHDDNTRRKIDPARPLGSSLEQMSRESPAYTDLAQLASRHGFSTVEQWSDVGDRTMQAYAIAKSGLSTAQVEAGYQQGVTNVKNDPSLNEGQKETILTRMERSHTRNMAARQAAEKDVSGVQPHLPALDKLLE